MEEVPFHVYAMKEPDYVMSLCLPMGPIYELERKHLVNGWMAVV